MLILPYSTALKLNQIPYITFSVIVLCIVIFLFQIQNRNAIETAVIQYCNSLQNDEISEFVARNKYDDMPKNEQYCIDIIYSMHSLKDLKDWNEIYLNYYLPDDEDDDLLKYIPFDLKRYQDFLASGAPVNLDVKLMYYPDTPNPFKMLTSDLSHGDWSHIIFNLIFFFAFTPTLEILIGNKLKFIAVLLLISFSGGITYSITSVIEGVFIPTLGLSGIVMGMIGFSAYMMPRASIRTLVWFIFFVRRLFIPVWILAIWYIGWDIYDLFSRSDNGATNFVAHVSGGVSGYVIARFWFKNRRDDIQEELDDAIEYSQAVRNDGFRGLNSLHMGDRTRIDSEHRESQAKKDWGRYKDRIYKLVMAGDSSNALLTILDDYEFISKTPETYEELFDEIGKWRKKRSYFCVGRLLINLYLEQGKLGNAVTVLRSCIAADSDFILPDSSMVLILAKVALNQSDYELAYRIIHDYKNRYFDNKVNLESIVLEAKLLYQHLNRRKDAIALLKITTSSVGIYDAKELKDLLKIIEGDN